MIGVLAALVAVLTAAACSTSSPSWPERVDIVLAPAPPAGAGIPAAGRPRAARPADRPPRDLMVCVVDGRHARCHHRDGVMPCTLTARGGAICAGALARLASPCPESGRCGVPAVAVPSGPFGLLVVGLNPPLFGVPRHAVVQAMILAPGPAAPPERDRRRIEEALSAVAASVAPGGTSPLVEAPLPIVTRADCGSGACAVGSVALTLAWHGQPEVVGAVTSPAGGQIPREVDR